MWKAIARVYAPENIVRAAERIESDRRVVKDQLRKIREQELVLMREVAGHNGLGNGADLYRATIPQVVE